MPQILSSVNRFISSKCQLEVHFILWFTKFYFRILKIYRKVFSLWPKSEYYFFYEAFELTFGSGNSLLKKEKTITAAPLISQYHLIIDYRHLAMMLEVSVRSLFYLVFHEVSEYLCILKIYRTVFLYGRSLSIIALVSKNPRKRIKKWESQIYHNSFQHTLLTWIKQC